MAVFKNLVFTRSLLLWAPNFPKNEHFFPNSLIPVRIRGLRNVCFFGKSGVFHFLATSVLRFVFLPYCRRVEEFKSSVAVKGK